MKTFDFDCATFDCAQAPQTPQAPQQPHTQPSVRLVDLLELYISTKRSGEPIDKKDFADRLALLGKSEAQIHDILIEFDDDCDKELLAGMGAKKAKRLMIFGLILGFGGIILSISMALGVFGSISGFTVVPYGIVAASFIAAGKAYAEIGLVKKRKKRRALKWENWK